MSVNYQSLSNWAHSGITLAQATTLKGQLDTFNNAWVSLGNKIATQNYTPTASDLASYVGNGSTSLTDLIYNLQNTCGNLLQAAANFIFDNSAVGGNGTTPFPANDSGDDSQFTKAVNAVGLKAPNNSNWNHLGNGWGDWTNQPNITFEGQGTAQLLSGGISSGSPTSAPGGAILKYNADGSYFPFTIEPGEAVQIAVGSSSHIWILGGNTRTGGNGAFYWNTATKTWVDSGGGLTQISVGYDGEVWGINNSGYIVHSSN